MGSRVDKPGLTRRRVLGRLASGAVFASTAPAWSAFCRAPTPGQAATSAAAPTPLARARTAPVVAAIRDRTVQELAHLLRTTPREKIFAATVEQIQRGATHREVLAGTLLAGIQDVRPRPPGTKFHTVLMVPSALQLAEAGDPADLWLPVFFNIDVLKWAQQRDINEGDWVLPPAPRPLQGDAAQIRAGLAAALEAWDEEAADRAATAAAHVLDLDDLFEVLWPMGARDFHNIGHKMIHTAQIYRALQIMDGPQREPAIRSLVVGLIGGAPGPYTADFEVNRKRIHDLPATWQTGRADPEASGELMRRLRTLDAGAAVDLVVSMLQRGVSPASIWDGLRLNASEMLFRLRTSNLGNAQLLAVHPLTILNAFQVAWEHSADDTTRRLMLLQAAAFMPLSRELLRDAKKLSMKGPGFDALHAVTDDVDVEGAVRAAADDAERSAAMVLGVTRDSAGSETFIDRCRSLVLRKAPEHHNHKYAAAAFEESRRADPRWRPYLLATCLTYLPTPGDPDSAVTLEARDALRRLGDAAAT